MTTLFRHHIGERSRLLTGLAVLGVAGVGVTSLVTGAFFTDSQSVGGNSITTGSVDIGVTPTEAAVTLPTMAPGDSITAPIAVKNNGSLALRYSLLSTSDATDANFLAAQLDMTVKTGVTTCTTAGFSATGAVAYGPGDFGSTSGTKVLGDAATGSNTGDRTLSAGASETLCLQVSLPSSTGNTYQAKTTTATFRFDAEQTVNNP